MGIDYSYECIEVRNVRRLEKVGDKELLLADLRFEDEHGHRLARVRDALVVLEDGNASLEQYAENIFSEDEDTADSDWERVEALCKNYPGYDVYNEPEFSKMVEEALAK